MPRTVRASLANYCYHVLNRGNARSQVFHQQADYAAFVGLIDEACRRRPMRVLGYCLMPNHFHLVLWPIADGDLSTWMAWLMNAHVRRHHQHYRSSGHIWQGRFKAFPIEEDEHLRVVLRYVERNPLRANLVEWAEAWEWSSLPAVNRSVRPPWLDPGPAPRGAGWVEAVNALAPAESEMGRLRRSVERGTPFGSDTWTSRTAGIMNLESTIRSRGRPRKSSKE
jgi:REP-associated tyrosine transposase